MTADVALYVPPKERSACEVSELYDARASLRVAFLCFSTNVDYGYPYVNVNVYL